jgi:hypothetical protein
MGPEGHLIWISASPEVRLGFTGLSTNPIDKSAAATRLHEQLKLSSVAIVVDHFATYHRAQHDGTQQTLHLKASTNVRHGWART